jgi:EF-P beta-lysylation protein EpmB
MIPANLAAGQPNWRQELADAVCDPAELLALLGLDQSNLPAARAAAQRFPLRVPRGFVARMRRGDPADPLLRQVLPLGAELDEVAGFGTDPVGDLASRRAPGLLAKYQGRALLVATGACGVHCRYCFRRGFPYADENPRADDWRAALAAIAADPTLSEVILSGGDPLSLSDRRLAELVARLDAIPHLTRLRIHTRQPVVLPSRVDDALLAWLGATRLRTVVVLHANHARELDREVRAACARLAATGATLLNQSVLLRGVNDSAGALADLSEALFAAGVLPYYLHQLDRVAGAAHFAVPDAEARALLDAAAERLPGYLVPRLVREVAGAPRKLPLELVPEVRA